MTDLAAVIGTFCWADFSSAATGFFVFPDSTANAVPGTGKALVLEEIGAWRNGHQSPFKQYPFWKNTHGTPCLVEALGAFGTGAATVCGIGTEGPVDVGVCAPSNASSG